MRDRPSKKLGIVHSERSSPALRASGQPCSLHRGIRLIQQLLGHVKAETTAIYAKVSIGYLKQMHGELSE